MQKAIYRIIDANFNRSREALRVMEEFCRFVLNSKPLNEQLKDFRHTLCLQIGKLDQDKLISARDTINDVGTDIKVHSQISRKSHTDAFTAACKRLPEALRVLTETIAPINPQIAAQIEKLRYKSYTLEKIINHSLIPSEKFKNVKLYVLITESQPDKILRLVTQCAAGGADCIQLRCKKLVNSDKELLNIATQFVQTCKSHNVISIINDRPDIAILSNADGLHLGQDDIPVADVQKIIQKPMIIGKSTHNTDQLNQAISENPTYVGLGPAFATETKPQEKPAGLEYISQAIKILENTGIFHAAIGGIKLNNLNHVLAAGVKTIAICSEVTNDPNPEKICKNFNKTLDSQNPN